MPGQSGGSPRNLHQQRKRAKDLLAAVRAGEVEALARLKPWKVGARGMKLAQAQLIVAREGGFDSWPKLVKELEGEELRLFKRAVVAGEAEVVRKLLSASARLRRKVNEPLFEFGRRPLNAAASNLATMDVLQQFGADIQLQSEWKAGPFGVMDECPASVARELLARGATLTAHAAARFGWMEELRQIVEATPAVVHEKGGDGQRPLHFSKTPAVADFLLEQGAEIDARCVDHHSTAAQYALKDRPAVTARLLERGALPDIFMAARLGDAKLARRLISEDPSCLAARTQHEGYAPVHPFGIYNWVIGTQMSPHECALTFEQPALYELLMQASGPAVRFLVCVMRGDEAGAREALRTEDALPRSLTLKDQGLLVHAAFTGKTKAVLLMLGVGFDPTARSPDGATALHAAAWVGNVRMVQALLKHPVDVNAVDGAHGSTPLGWAAHGSVYGPKKRSDRAAVVKLLVEAGADVHAPGNKHGVSLVGMAEGNALAQVLKDYGAT